MKKFLKENGKLKSKKELESLILSEIESTGCLKLGSETFEFVVWSRHLHLKDEFCGFTMRKGSMARFLIGILKKKIK